MKYDKANKILIFYLCVIFLYMLTFFSLTSIATNIELGVGDFLTYEVLESSGTENVFYGTWPPGTYFGNWSVVPNDQILYLITSITETDINGTLFLGNAFTNSSFYNVRNVDLAFGLTIGIYPWNGGFYANSSDWENIESQIQQTNTTIDEISNFEQIINGENEVYEVILFQTSDYYGQFSTLYYHSSTGVLLKAHTSFGLYELSIELISTNLEIESQTKTVFMDLSSLLVIFTLISFFKIMEKRSNKRKR